MTKVSLIKQDSYELESLKKTIKQSLSNIIDIKEIFSNNKKVLIKVNAVSNMKQDLGYTTNPSFLKALIQVLKEFPVKIYVGDNPPFKDLKQVLKGNGMYKVIIDENVELIDNIPSTTIKTSRPIKFSEFNVSKNFVEADIMINVPKLKTHSLSYLSCAEKNLFGLIYGLQKANWHVKASDPHSFGCLINDLYIATKECFKENHLIHLCDAITCLEGDGPTTGGTTKHIGAIICSTSAISLDQIALKVASLDASKSFITSIALENKLEDTSFYKIELIGNSIDEFKDNFLKEPLKPLRSIKILEKQFIKNILLEHPIIDYNKCLKCGSCVKICPPHTMKMTKSGEIPHLNPKKCIRCWCCSEVCQLRQSLRLKDHCLEE